MTEGLARTIENPIAAERVTFLATAEETGGEYVRMPVTVESEDSKLMPTKDRQEANA